MEPSKTSSKKPRVRREQARSIETRQLILSCALKEFARRGYDGTSTRNIAERANILHPLITYHFATKEILWKAVAERYLIGLVDEWEKQVPMDEQLSASERVRQQLEVVCKVLLDNPDIHRFMMQENLANSPRMRWVAETVVRPLLNSVLPNIEEAQQDGCLPAGRPIFIYYMMIGMATVLANLPHEIAINAGLDVADSQLHGEYTDLIRQIFFRC